MTLEDHFVNEVFLRSTYELSEASIKRLPKEKVTIDLGARMLCNISLEHSSDSIRNSSRDYLLKLLQKSMSTRRIDFIILCFENIEKKQCTTYSIELLLGLLPLLPAKHSLMSRHTILRQAISERNLLETLTKEYIDFMSIEVIPSSKDIVGMPFIFFNFGRKQDCQSI
jgi:hypothetical protein